MSVKNTYSLIISFLFIQATAMAQMHTCGFDYLLENNSNVKNALIKQTQEFNTNYQRQQLRRGFEFTFDTTYEITVVFHILHNNVSENIPDTCILTQMDVLNEDFNRLNADTSKTRGIFSTVAGRLPFRFKLADKDPNGNPHSGIIRVATNTESFASTSGGIENNTMKFSNQGGSDAWDTKKYLNIWVCDLFPLGGANSFVAGFATPPTGAENWPSGVQFPENEQGAVCHYWTVGRYNARATANGANSLGRTTTHELGHYFGLFHTWGLQQNSCNTFFDDFIDDTPNTAGPNFSCSFNTNSCDRNVQGDLPDMIENYMDYSNGFCQNIFTQQQSALMFSNLKRFRKSNITYDVRKDSFESTETAITPRLFSNPGNNLVIGANKYSTNSFNLNVYDNLGKKVLEQSLILDNVKTIDLARSLNYGHYTVIINSDANGNSFIYKWAKFAL